MIWQAPYQKKFQFLQNSFSSIIKEIEQDLKTLHLRSDKRFKVLHFSNHSPRSIPIEKLISVYHRELVETSNDPLSEFVANRWLLNNENIYQLFEEQLKKTTPDFDKITEIESSIAQKIIDDSISQFGVEKTLIFSILNSVVFPQEIYDQLKNQINN